MLFGTSNHDNPRAFDTLVELTKDLKNLHIYTKPQVDRLSTSEGGHTDCGTPWIRQREVAALLPKR